MQQLVAAILGLLTSLYPAINDLSLWHPSTTYPAKSKQPLALTPTKPWQPLARTPISVHCWQGDDDGGFDSPSAGDLGGGLAVTGNHPGRGGAVQSKWNTSRSGALTGLWSGFDGKDRDVAFVRPVGPENPACSERVVFEIGLENL